MRSYDYFSARKGERKQSFQINEDRDTGRITVGVVTDVSEVCAESREAYRETVRREELALDFGLATMFATDGGDLFGRDFLKKLKKLDDNLTKMTRKLQKVGHKPRSSSRYKRMTSRVRGFVTSEINRLVSVHRPSKLALERLDFQDAGVSRRMRRILHNCGRDAVKAKLRSLNEQLGIEAEEISPRMHMSIERS